MGLIALAEVNGIAVTDMTRFCGGRRSVGLTDA
jgi:hypothetical protein